MSNRIHMICNQLSNHNNSKVSSYLKDPLDFLKLDQLIPSEINSKRKALRALLDSEISPILPEYFEKAEFPFHVLPKIQSIFGLTKAGYGCREIGLLEKCLYGFELARVDASLLSFYGFTMGVVIYTIEKLGSEAQKKKYLPGLCDLSIFGCWALTEPLFGSDAASIQTKAEPVEGGFEITGEKRWIGNAGFSDIMIIWARNTETKEIQGFIIPSKSQGVKIQNIERKIAMRISQTGDIIMNRVFVPAENRLEKATNFINGPNLILEQSRKLILWTSTGIMAGVYEKCVEFLREKKQFDAPLSAFQLNQEKLVRILAHFQAAFLMSWKLTTMNERARPENTSLIKGWITSVGREVVRLGREIFGGDGIIIDNYVGKAMADMEVVHTYEGTYDVNVLAAGRAITGISAFKSSYKKGAKK